MLPCSRKLSPDIRKHVYVVWKWFLVNNNTEYIFHTSGNWLKFSRSGYKAWQSGKRTFIHWHKNTEGKTTHFEWQDVTVGIFCDDKICLQKRNTFMQANKLMWHLKNLHKNVQNNTLNSSNFFFSFAFFSDKKKVVSMSFGHFLAKIKIHFFW